MTGKNKITQQLLIITMESNLSNSKKYCPKFLAAICFARTKLNNEKNLSFSQNDIIKAGIKIETYKQTNIPKNATSKLA